MISCALHSNIFEKPVIMSLTSGGDYGGPCFVVAACMDQADAQKRGSSKIYFLAIIGIKILGL